MKRLFCLFAALLLAFLLFACGQRNENVGQNDDTAPPPAEAEPISLAQLNVEFVKGERDTTAMLRLKKELPPLLKAALKAQDVTVETVNITFGASAEATARALSAGSVQLGFLPASVYCAYADALRPVAALEQRTPQSLIGLYLPYAEHNAALVEKLTSVPWGEAFTKEDLTQAHWALPADDEAAERYLEFLLQREYGLSLDALENLSYYADFAQRDEALKTADFLLLYGFEWAQSPLCAMLESLALEGEVAAVSAADEIVSGEVFRAAVQAALGELCLDEAGQAVLALYGGEEYVSYHAADDSTYLSLRHVLGYEEE